MSYGQLGNKILQEKGVEQSTMMNSPCLRYNGSFIAMMFEREDALIIKVAKERVSQLIAAGVGREFNFTKKRFKEWVLIPAKYDNEYESYVYEALEFARKTERKKRNKT